MAKLLKKLFWPIVVLSLIALYANLRVERFRVAAAAPRVALAAPAVLAKPSAAKPANESEKKEDKNVEKKRKQE
jgi:hypothetical protein